MAHSHPRSSLGSPDALSKSGVGYVGVQETAESLPPKIINDDTLEASLTSVKSRPPIKTLLVQILAGLWLAPAIAILVLNIRGTTIGPTAWCPFGKCSLFATSNDQDVAGNRLHKFDKDNHNLLGFLQLIAKLLEIWFGLISGNLLFMIIMRIAGSKGGIPLGYLSQFIQFAEIRNIFDGILWRLLPTRRTAQIQRSLALWAFVLFTVSLGILFNLMGPATAVLVLPSLMWLPSPNYEKTIFHSLNSADPPGSNGVNFTAQVPSCSLEDVQNERWSCTEAEWSYLLDSVLVDWNYASMEIATTGLGTSVFLEKYCSFSYNISSDVSQIIWAPNRQVISKFSEDLVIMNNMSLNSPPENPQVASTYEIYTNSLNVEIHRKGPMLGFYSNVLMQNGRTIEVKDIALSADKGVRCYPEYFTSYLNGTRDGGNYTRCIQVGKEWGPNTKQTRFFVNIESALNNRTQSDNTTLQFNVYSSEKAVYLPYGNVPPGMQPSCLGDSPPPSNFTTKCDWDAFFASNMAPETTNITKYPITVELVVPENETDVIFAADFVAYMGFTEYQFNPWTWQNLANFVQSNNPDNSEPVAVDPAWVLALWSVDPDGYLMDNRTSSLFISNLVNHFLLGTEENTDVVTVMGELLSTISFAPFALLMSLLSFNEVDDDGSTKIQNEQYRFQRTAQINVWAYGISSRTSYLGCVVVILGCIVTVMQVVLGFCDRRPRRSMTELLTAALQHQPGDEFDGLGDDKNKAAGVTFRLVEQDHIAGRMLFLPSKVTHRDQRRYEENSLVG